jgi:hypothetical protein
MWVSYVILGGVVVGASWYLGRLASGPSGKLVNKLSLPHSALTVHVFSHLVKV